MILGEKGELDLIAYGRRDGIGIVDKPSVPNGNFDNGPEGRPSEERTGYYRSELHIVMLFSIDLMYLAIDELLGVLMSRRE